MRRLLLLTAVSCLPALPAAAQYWEPGEGCTATLTVQGASCIVTNLWTCPSEPGLIHYADHRAGVRDSAGIIDAEGQWLLTTWEDGWTETLEEPVADRHSRSTLLTTGIDHFTAILSATAKPDETEVIARTLAQGTDILLAEDTEIDGEPLRQLAYSYVYRNDDGSVYSVSQGVQFYAPAYGAFFLGLGMTTTQGVTEFSNDTPVDFIRPGEEGFGSIVATQGCEAPQG